MGTFSSTANFLAQSSDPGAIGAGAIWSDTDASILYRRNDANDDWLEVAVFGGGTGQTANQFVQVNSGGTALETVAKTDFTNAFVRLDAHETSSSAASYTFTPSSALDWDTYSEIIVKIRGGTSGGTGTVSAEINGITSYGVTTIKNINGTGSDVQAAPTELTLIDAADIAAARDFMIDLHIYNSETGDNLHGWATTQVEADNIATFLGFTAGASITTFTSVLVQISAGNFVDGTRIDTYGVLRA